MGNVFTFSYSREKIQGGASGISKPSLFTGYSTHRQHRSGRDLLTPRMGWGTYPRFLILEKTFRVAPLTSLNLTFMQDICPPLTTETWENAQVITATRNIPLGQYKSLIISHSGYNKPNPGGLQGLPLGIVDKRLRGYIIIRDPYVASLGHTSALSSSTDLSSSQVGIPNTASRNNCIALHFSYGYLTLLPLSSSP